MAVPKRKTSKSRRNMRRSHLGLKKVNAVVDKDSGEYKLPHRICLVTNSYKGKTVKLEKQQVTAKAT